jgi:hypothetical protein
MMLPCLTIADLPFFPRPPAYGLHLAQLIVGAISLRVAFLKQPLTSKDGQAFPSQRLLKTTFFIFGTLMVVFGTLDLILKIP